jgi:hypothetical protein
MVEPEQRVREAAEKPSGRAAVHDVGKGRIAREHRHGCKRDAQQTDGLSLLTFSHAGTTALIYHDHPHKREQIRLELLRVTLDKHRPSADLRGRIDSATKWLVQTNNVR